MRSGPDGFPEIGYCRSRILPGTVASVTFVRVLLVSYREREVLLRMVEGQPVSQIAVESVVSTSTVWTHVRSILTKLGVRSRLEAVSVARAAGLWPTGDQA